MQIKHEFLFIVKIYASVLSALAGGAGLISGTALTVVQTVGTHVDSMHSDTTTNIDRIRRLKDEIEQNIKSLEQSNNDITKSVIPSFNFFQQILAKLDLDNLTSHLELDIKRWNVQSALKDMKQTISRLVDRFDAGKDIVVCIEKLVEAVSVLIDAYDRIQNYADMKAFDDYNMNMNVLDPLNNNRNIISLTGIIKSNRVVEVYDKLIVAFKINHFPFAIRLKKHLYDLDVNSNNVTTLVERACSNIDEMNQFLSNNRNTYQNSSKDLRTKVPFDGTGAFFKWEYNLYKTEIKKLLRGEEVVLKADITKALGNRDAVKFNVIRINPTLKEDSKKDSRKHSKKHSKKDSKKDSEKDLKQAQFDQIFRQFEVNMEMFGRNYYSCNRRIYYISEDTKFKFSYSMNITDGTQINLDGNYNEITQNHPFLSPYTMWRIKLNPQNNRKLLDNLKQFQNEVIDLELEGSGKYFLQGRHINSVCTEELNDFYKKDDSTF